MRTHASHASMPSSPYTNAHKTSMTKGPSTLGVSAKRSRMGDRTPKDSGGVNHHYKTCKEIMSKESSKRIFLYSTLK
jgi:hypothetical protein